jgi:hypothetical protein
MTSRASFPCRQICAIFLVLIRKGRTAMRVGKPGHAVAGARLASAARVAAEQVRSASASNPRALESFLTTFVGHLGGPSATASAGGPAPRGFTSGAPPIVTRRSPSSR